MEPFTSIIKINVHPGLSEADLKPWEPKQVDKHKVWDAAAAVLRTNGAKECCFDGKPLTVNGQTLTASFADAILS